VFDGRVEMGEGAGDAFASFGEGVGPRGIGFAEADGSGRETERHRVVSAGSGMVAGMRRGSNSPTW
jgi:hypothetical protein